MYFKQRNQSGFSILETLIVILISSMTLIVSSPTYRKILSSIDKSMTLEQIKADFSRARSLALSRGGRVILSVDNDNNSYSFGIDYAPFSSPAVADLNLFETKIPEQISIVENETIIFSSSGKLIDADGNNNQVNVDLQREGVDFANLTVYLSGFVEKQ